MRRGEATRGAIGVEPRSHAGARHTRGPRTPTTCDDKQWCCYGIFTCSCDTCCPCTCSHHEARRRLSIVTVAAGYAASILAAVLACRLDPVDDASIKRSNGTKQDPSIHTGRSRWGAQPVSCDARRGHASSVRAGPDVYRPLPSVGRASQPWDQGRCQAGCPSQGLRRAGENGTGSRAAHLAHRPRRCTC